jgi:sRNA-binding protein
MFGLSVAAQAQEKAPGVVILKGNPMGGVKFDHAAHQKVAGNKCETCHHASKAQKPMKAAHENCQDCHTKTATAPMKTTTKLAFHDNMAKAGICIDCHVKQNAAGKKAPTKCTECHQKANV